MKNLLMIALAAPALSLCAQSESFFQASLTPDIAVQSRDTIIKGISLNIWGENEQHSFTLGFVNGSVGESSGLSWGLVNYAENYTGVHLGIVNLSKDSFKGVQAGTVNVAKAVNGLQWGLVNYTDELEGVQLGAVNIVTTSPWFNEFPDKLAKGFVFVNWSF